MSATPPCDRYVPHGRAARRPDGPLRARVRSLPAGTLVLRAFALSVGGVCVLAGCLAVVLPGPLSIPPILFGLWVLAGEYAWADRLLVTARARARSLAAATRRRRRQR